MANKSSQMDFRGLEILADKFVGETEVSPDVEAVTTVSTADAADSGDWTADGAAVVALANALKAKINELIGALKS